MGKSKLVRVQVLEEGTGFLVVPWFRLEDGRVVSVPADDHPCATINDAVAEINQLLKDL